MPQKVFRKVATIPFAEGVRNSVLIDRDGVLMGFKIILKSTLTGGATPPVGPLAGGWASLIQRFELQLDGQDTPINIDGLGLAAQHTKDFGYRPYGYSTALPLIAGATTNTVIMFLPIFLARGRRPDDTGYDLRKLQQASLAITWGNPQSLYTTPGTVAISGVQCDIEALYHVFAPGEASPAYLARVLDMVNQPITGTNDNVPILMDRGQDVAYRSYLGASLVDGVLSNSPLNSAGRGIRLESGSFVWVNRSGESVYSDWFDLVQEFEANSAVMAGLHYIDLTKFGDLTTIINTGILSADLYMRLNWLFSGTTNIFRLYREAIRPLRV